MAGPRQEYAITHLCTREQVLENVEQLSEILQTCVDEGSSIGFLAPLSTGEATQYWTSVSHLVTAGTCFLYILSSRSPSPRILGTIQLITIPKITHRHRGEVVKLLVRPEGRRKGVASALMRHVEVVAKDQGRELLMLDTATLSDAMAIYRNLGWEEWGTCKDYACWPDGSRCDATFFRKEI
ncbi:hypothetical protein PVAG01_11295 [Phlyctema vagabunda]|uniref:N-acetyltransferase domain-containing protein n=1 Tax=Phlyctema vagabunda TaxID=108571 RepID=A0ABR4P1X0_9HELO